MKPERRLIKEVEGMEHARAFIGTEYASAIFSNSTHMVGFAFDKMSQL